MKKRLFTGIVSLGLVTSLSGCAQSTASSVVNSGSPYGAGAALGQALGKSLWGGK
jgi:hypothetical protein